MLKFGNIPNKMRKKVHNIQKKATIQTIVKEKVHGTSGVPIIHKKMKFSLINCKKVILRAENHNVLYHKM